MEKTTTIAIILTLLTAVFLLVSLRMQYSDEMTITIPNMALQAVITESSKEVRAFSNRLATGSTAITTSGAKSQSTGSTAITTSGVKSQSTLRKIAAPSQDWIRSNIATLCQSNSLRFCNLTGKKHFSQPSQ